MIYRYNESFMFYDILQMSTLRAVIKFQFSTLRLVSSDKLDLVNT